MAALGEAEGPDGERFLRRLISDRSRSDDERCAALIALGKRSGVGGSDCFAEALTDRRTAVKDYAADCLCAYGDDRAWEAMLARLKKELAKPSSSPVFADLLAGHASPVVEIGYLARHASTPDRATVVAGLVRPAWDNLDEAERQWVLDFWPAIAPSAAPDRATAVAEFDARRIATWKRDPLYLPLYRQ